MIQKPLATSSQFPAFSTFCKPAKMNNNRYAFIFSTFETKARYSVRADIHSVFNPFQKWRKWHTVNIILKLQLFKHEHATAYLAPRILSVQHYQIKTVRNVENYEIMYPETILPSCNKNLKPIDNTKAFLCFNNNASSSDFLVTLQYGPLVLHKWITNAANI